MIDRDEPNYCPRCGLELSPYEYPLCDECANEVGLPRDPDEDDR